MENPNINIIPAIRSIKPIKSKKNPVPKLPITEEIPFNRTMIPKVKAKKFGYNKEIPTNMSKKPKMAKSIMKYAFLLLNFYSTSQ